VIPANLSSIVRAWTLTQTVDGSGLQADRAEVEYGPIDEATFIAAQDTFLAADPTDTFGIVYEVDGAPIELFRGLVLDWRLLRRRGPNRRETYARLVALDARDALLRTLAPRELTFRGVTVSQTYVPGVGVVEVRTPGSTFATVMQVVAARTGLLIDTGAVNYTLSRPIVLAGLTWGRVLEELLAPLQQVRSTRADFARDGNRYIVRRRALTLGAPDVTIPAEIVDELDYGKTRPRTLPAPTDQLTSAQEYVGIASGTVASPPSFQSGPWEERFDVPDGRTVRQYLNGQLQSEVITHVAGGATVEDSLTYIYDIRRHLVEVRIQTVRNGVLGAAGTQYIAYDASGRPTLGSYSEEQYDANGAVASRSRETVTKPYANRGSTLKALLRERIDSAGVVTLEPRTLELVPGNFSATPEDEELAVRVGPFPLRSEPSDVDQARLDTEAQEGRALVDATYSCPLDDRISPAKIVELTGDASIVPARVYVTSCTKRWQSGSNATRHRMTFRGEAWTL
jgi:hypothetical protein